MASFSNLPFVKSALHHHYQLNKNNQVLNYSWWFQHIFFSCSPLQMGNFSHFGRIFFGEWVGSTTNVWGLGGQWGAGAGGWFPSAADPANGYREDGNGTTESGLGRWGSSILRFFFCGVDFFWWCIFLDIKIVKNIWKDVKIIRLFWWWRFCPLKIDVDL